MNSVLCIAAGGAVGALLRYGVGRGVQGLFGGTFPYGTLAVNVSGCLLMGLLYVLLFERLDVRVEWRGALLIGLLGAYTTFSSLSIETLNLIEAGEALKAGVNVVLSAALCLAATWLGVAAARAL
jgi:CrcB protein